MSVVVSLTWPEVSYAAKIGVDRQLQNMKQGNHDAHRFDGDPFSVHIAGALAECAFAKSRDSYWLPWASDPKSLSGDVGTDQVRSTTRKNGCLILHPDDSDTARFWLVTGTVPTYEIVGWIYGKEGKLPQYWREDLRRPCFMYPAGNLRPVPVRSAVAA